MYRLIFLCFIIASNCKGQSFDKYWHIVDVKNTLLELGAKTPAIKNFATIKKCYRAGTITFHNSYFLFSKKLQSTDCYSDTVFISTKHQVPKKNDTEISFRYPGDELSCDSSDIFLDKCYVGTSFMQLINLNASSLTFYEGTGNAPNKFSYKLCVISQDRLALLCDNANVVLILARDKKSR